MTKKVHLGPADPNQARFDRSGTRGARTLASAFGVRSSQTTRFLSACGHLERFKREVMADPTSRERLAHITGEIADEGRSLVERCERCGAEDRIALPKPARAMQHPAGVPPGLGEEIWQRSARFRAAHEACAAPVGTLDGGPP